MANSKSDLSIPVDNSITFPSSSSSSSSTTPSSVILNDEGILLEIPDENDLGTSPSMKKYGLSSSFTVIPPTPSLSLSLGTDENSLVYLDSSNNNNNNNNKATNNDSSSSSSAVPPDTTITISAPSTESNRTGSSSSNASLILPPILRNLRTTASASNRTFFCGICLEEKSINQSYQLSCSHRFCKNCLYEYFSSRISERKVFLTCFAEQSSSSSSLNAVTSSVPEALLVTRTPSNSSTNSTNNATASSAPSTVNPIIVTNAPSSSSSSSSTTPNDTVGRLVCAMPIRESDILTVLTGYRDGLTIIEKYRRFAAESKNPNLRSCPYCATLQEGNAAEPLMLCTNTACRKEFCFLHSNAHVGSTCTEFDRQHSEENRINLAAIAEDTKPCPNCGIRISKLTGCNHMKCTSCGTSFCWLCGKKVEDSDLPTHFQFWNIMGCPNKQFNESNGSWFQFFSTIFVFFLFGIPSILITLSMFIVCPCVCFPLGFMDNNGFSSYFMTISSVVMYLLIFFLGATIGLPFVVAFGIASLPFLCMYACLRGNEANAAAARRASRSSSSSTAPTSPVPTTGSDDPSKADNSTVATAV